MEVLIEYLPSYDVVEWGELKQAYEGDAGFDVRAVEDTLIEPHTWALIKLGIKSSIPVGYEVQLRSRSGLSLKEGLFLLNGVGTIDCNYRGEWGAIVANFSGSPYRVLRGDRIAQAVVQMLPTVTITRGLVDVTSRGSKGFGSSGVSSGCFGSSGKK